MNMEGLTTLTVEQMLEFLKQSYIVDEVKDIQYGVKISLKNGAIVNVFHTGKYNVQGKNSAEVKACIETGEIRPIAGATKSASAKNDKVFVVYGHDEPARMELETLLRRWGLEPIILDLLPSGGQTIIEKLETYVPSATYGIVLATPDDKGHRADAPHEEMFRCRQNVVLEMGMLLAKLGRDRVAVLLKKPTEMERPSDIQGILYIPVDARIEPEASRVLARELESKLGIVIPASVL